MMNLQLSITEDVAPLERELNRVFALKSAAATYPGGWFEQLWAIASNRATGGKYVRPRLFLNALSAITGRPATDVPESMKIAAAIELLHYSFLLHDDVIDGDIVRRGKPNFIGELAATRDTEGLSADRRLHWAQSCAILMGNLLLSEVHQIAAGLDLDTNTRSRFFDLLNHTITESVVGEQLDVGLSDKVIPAELSTILSMCIYKTATYTFEMPLRAASIIAQIDQNIDPLLSQASRFLGLAFQLQDDLLSMFVDAGEHGKDPYSDLREGKETALIAYARMTSAWPSIEPLMGEPHLTAAQGESVSKLLETCGARGFVESLIDEQVRALHELLAEHHTILPQALIELLITLASDLEGRTS